MECRYLIREGRIKPIQLFIEDTIDEMKNSIIRNRIFKKTETLQC